MSPADEARLAALVDQRDFLLTSLEDLERERAAGDVDEADYRALKDDYTARAARVIRSLEDGRAQQARGGGRRVRRRLAAVAGVVAFAVGAGVLVAQTAGRRDAGDQLSGDVRQSVTEKLNEAGRRGSQGDYPAAIEIYDEVLATEPDQPEAMAYRGWMQLIGGDPEAGLLSLLEAATAHPEYPDVHAFLAVAFFRQGLVAEAGRELDRLDALDPPAAIRSLTDPLRERIDQALATTSTVAP